MTNIEYLDSVQPYIAVPHRLDFTNPSQAIEDIEAAAEAVEEDLGLALYALALQNLGVPASDIGSTTERMRDLTSTEVTFPATSALVAAIQVERSNKGKITRLIQGKVRVRPEDIDESEAMASGRIASQIVGTSTLPESSIQHARDHIPHRQIRAFLDNQLSPPRQKARLSLRR